MEHDHSHADHLDKMCAMTCCPCNVDVDKLKPVVSDPKFICKMCGHVAHEAKNLCEGVPLD